jgi:polyferredoxin
MPPATLLQPEEHVLSTLNKDGSRHWITPRLSRGRFLRYRRAVGYFLIALFVTLPHLRMNDKPIVLLDIMARQFTLFGKTFLPTDSLLLALLGVGTFLSIFLITALFGRVWCGWACPQTVYLELVFRPIERLFEGEPGRSKPTSARGLRKAGKFLVFLALAMGLAHTFLAYFVGTEALAVWIRSSPLEHPTGFIVMAFVTGAMLFDFGFFREQTCIVACPYGRFQSVMLDRNSLIVSYDKARGEPRGKGANRKAPADLALPILRTEKASLTEALSTSTATAPVSTTTRGDCVDCGLCVATCPTGIDIRGGLQMECVSCTQCIDACDAVMTKLKRPTGLIRYTSQAALEHAAGIGAKPRLLRPRVLIYPALIIIVAVAFITLLATAGPVDVSLTRGRGLPFNTLPDGRISNQMNFKLTSRTDSERAFSVSIEGDGQPAIELPDNPIRLAAGQIHADPVILSISRSAFRHGTASARIRVTDEKGQIVATRHVTLIGPAGDSDDDKRSDEHDSKPDDKTPDHPEEHK